MAVPTVVQVSAVTEAVAYSTARSVTFTNDVTAGNSLILLGWVGNDSVTDLASVTASVTQTGAIFIRRLDSPIRYRQGAGITIWTAEDVDGGTGVKTITVTPAVADAGNYCGLVALEVTGRASGLFEAAVGNNTEHGAFNVAVGPCPATGSISQADTMAIFVSMVNQSTNNSNPGWVLPSGWTERAKTLDCTNAKRAIFVGSKTQTSTSALSLTISTTEADLYGRVGALLIVRGDTGSSAEPPPAPTPSPPPPPPGPAPSPPPPGPAPAPASYAFDFLNADPDLAGEGGVHIQIHTEPTGDDLLGDYIQVATGQEFVADGDYSKIRVEHDGVVTVTAGQTVVAVGQNAGNTAGFRGVIEGTVVEL